jgi:hypothetical protein
MPIVDYKIILDAPSKNPALGFGQVAEALKGIIEGSRPQFAIGIFGTWGSGKTTLMRAIEARLDPTRTISVQFSAWRYEREPQLIVPLLDTVREALITWAEKNKTFEQSAMKTAVTVGKAMYSLLAGVSFKLGVPNALELSFDANEALDQAKKFSDEEKAARTSRSFYHATFKALQETFSEFVGPTSGRRIVVFVDDLDRCLPQGALEVLEAMKLFFDLEGFVFVVGLDQAVVERSIDLKYRADGTPGEAEKGAYQIRGSDYIKKIFQLPYGVAPVAFTQLQEFLDAVYSEAALPPDQVQELRNIVSRHLRYVLAESGVNPRELKRYLNAYTLVIKIKQHLNKDVVLALQTVAFRRDWEIVRRAILSYREVFTDAVRRQLNGENTAITDLDPTLAGVPDSFLTYVSPSNPGESLLNIPILDEYIYAGEATTSSQGSLFIDAIRDVAQLTKPLRLLESAPSNSEAGALTTYVSSVHSALSRAKEVARGRLDRLTQGWTEHVTAFSPGSTDETKKQWIGDEEKFRRNVLTQLMELYQAGSQTASSAA